MSNELDLRPPNFLVKGEGRNDLTILIQLGFDATGGEHVLYLASTPNGAATYTFTPADTLVIQQVSGLTEVSFTFTRDLTEALKDVQTYLAYILTLSGIRRTQATAQVFFKGGIYAG